MRGPTHKCTQKNEAIKEVGENIKETHIRQLEISNILYETKTKVRKIQNLNGRIKNIKRMDKDNKVPQGDKDE